jgi:hypothetical protein
MATNHSDAQPPAWSHADVVEILEHAALFLQASVSGLKNERLDDQVVAEGATVRDIITHLAAWEGELLDEGQALSRGVARFNHSIAAGPVGGGCLLAPNGAASPWDEEQRRRRKEQPTGAIFLELEQAQHRLLAFARNLAPRKLGQAADLPWGRHATLADLLVTAAAHKRGHAEVIREWRTSQHF